MMHVASGGIPRGCRVEETSERVDDYELTCWTKRGALKRARRGTPGIPSYRLVVERQGLLRWSVVAYQNKLVKI